jgi:glycine C-acetyltransferase
METDLLTQRLTSQLAEFARAGLHKTEHPLTSPQQAQIMVEGTSLINFASNNYLGLANHPAVLSAAQEGLQQRGYGLSSVRFISGTQDIHQALEASLATLVKQENSVLYSSCFAANTGLLGSFLGEDDAIFTDQLNHASLIDGIRLCKAERFIFQHRDMRDLEEKLSAARERAVKVIVTDGVFSMDGEYAPLAEIVELAERYEALVVVDDSHATGFVGEGGRGSHQRAGVADRIDVITSTLGKALGGALGGFTATSGRLADYLRDFSRPYLFSNSLSPVIVAASAAAVALLDTPEGEKLRQKLWDNTRYVREGLGRLGVTIIGDEHPIVPVLLNEATRARKVAADLRDHGIFAVAFGYPVVPQGQARIRLQVSAAHERAHLDRLLTVFESLV